MIGLLYQLNLYVPWSHLGGSFERPQNEKGPFIELQRLTTSVVYSLCSHPKFLLAIKKVSQPNTSEKWHPQLKDKMVVSLKSKAKIGLAIDSDAAMTLSPPSSSFFVEFFFLKLLLL